MTTREILICEELFLLGHDDEKGGDTTYWGLDGPLAGAILLDLAAGRFVAEADGDLVAAGGSTPEARLLADALGVIRESARPRDAKHWVGKLPEKLKPFKQRVAEQLVEDGVLAQERRKALGIFPTTRFPERDAAVEEALRARIRQVLLEGREPTPREAQLIALLMAAGLVGDLVPKDRRREAKQRAEAVAERDLAGHAVERAVRDVQAAVTAAVIAGSAVAAAGGGDGGGGGGGG